MNFMTSTGVLTRTPIPKPLTPAWESVRLFWYAVRGNKDGINEKHGYVLEALRRFELSKEL
jgi:hypothetical protein